MRHNPQYIDIEIDKLTNSVENVITGDNFQTDFSLIDKSDLKTGNVVYFHFLSENGPNQCAVFHHDKRTVTGK
jgi:hypothetical protein